MTSSSFVNPHSLVEKQIKSEAQTGKQAVDRAATFEAFEAALKAKDAATPALQAMDILVFAGDLGNAGCYYQVIRVVGTKVYARPIVSEPKPRIGAFVGGMETGLALGKTAVLFGTFGKAARTSRRAFTRAQVKKAAEQRKRFLQVRTATTPTTD